MRDEMPGTPAANTTIGLVVIGRNEGERLVRALQSLAGGSRTVVYVDSNSSDDSVDNAEAAGAEVVRLDPKLPMSAARARNAGFQRLVELVPDLTYVQFVDGDCEMQGAWLESAQQFLADNADVAVVCGRRRERFPDASPYNRLADIEWDTPVGESDACGGDAMMVASAVEACAGYNPSLIAGEDPELCFRLRQEGWRVVRLDEEMTLHDAAITEFRQWWRRSVRTGHAFAESALMHGRSKERYCVRPVLSILAWAAVLPATAVAFAWPTGGISLTLLLLYLVLWLRIWRSRRERGASTSDARLYASACVVGKFAELTGVARFAWNRWVRRRRSELIEYKGA